MLLVSLKAQLEQIRALVSGLETECLSGRDAASLVEVFSSLEHVCGAGKAICARRVSQTGYFERLGHKDAASWLAGLSGETRGATKDLLETASHLSSMPGLLDAFTAGELSSKEASEIARAAVLDPSAESELLETARSGSLGELRERAEALRAASRSKEEEEKRHARVHKNRHLSTWTDREGAFTGRFSLTPEDGAVLMGRLEKMANGIFDEARRRGEREPRAAYLADALVALASGEGDPSLSPDYTILMRVDLDALARGHVEKGEECSIEGVGHVPVSVVQSYLDVAKVRLVVTKGTDIASVYSFSRNIGAALRTALQFRDRTCVVPGCTSTFHLEIDHITEYAKSGPTSLQNTCRLCRFHHRLKTHRGYKIEGGPGAWRWEKPPGEDPGERAVRSDDSDSSFDSPDPPAAQEPARA